MSRIVEGMTEAVAVAKGEVPAARIYQNGHFYVPEDDLKALQAELDALKALKGAAPQKPEIDRADALQFHYRNHAGQISERTVAPVSVMFGETKWHTTPGWLMTAWDYNQDAFRDFAMSDIGAVDRKAVEAVINDMEAAVSYGASVSVEEEGALSKWTAALREAVPAITRVEKNR